MNFKDFLNKIYSIFTTHNMRMELLKRKYAKLNKVKYKAQKELELRRKISEVVREITDTNQTNEMIKHTIQKREKELKTALNTFFS